jgi:hypothetical protein
MIPSNLTSVHLFKKHITEFDVNFQFKDDEYLLNVLQLIIKSSEEERIRLLKNELNGIEINYEKFFEDYITQLVDHFVQITEANDPIINALLESNSFSFADKVEEGMILKTAILRFERKQLKEELIQFDQQQEDADLEVAIARNQRKELKGLLENAEKTSRNRGAGSNRLNMFNNQWLKIAAVVLVILVPLGILIFRKDSSIQLNERAISKNKKSEQDKAIAEMKGVDELLILQLPEVKGDQFVKIVIEDQESFGYAQDNKEIKINVVQLEGRMDYLKDRSVLIDKKISALENELEKLDKSKKIDAKNASNIEQLLIKLSNKSDECKKLITSIEKQKNTYSFDGKNLTLSFLELIDQDQLQVISRIDIENNQNEQFYLKMNNEYFLLNVSKQNKLNRISDDSLIDELNDIN